MASLATPSRDAALTRRRFLAALGIGTVTTGSVAGYARIVEPAWFEVTQTSIQINRPGTGTHPFRILHLSDFHASAVVPLSDINEAIGLGLAAAPDLVLLTGDFITGQDIPWTDYASVLSELSAAAPTLACLGNHDGGVWTQRVGRPYSSQRVETLLAESGIELLHNRSVVRRIGHRPVRITGAGDLWSGECQPAIAFHGHEDATPSDMLHFVLNHNPDAKDLFNPYAWDLMLCGHTHGGQLRLPIIGTPFAPVRDKRYVAGLHPWDGRQLYVTRGVGNLHGIRFNCRPEVTVLQVSGAA